MTILEAYGKSVERDRPSDVHDLLEQYHVERQKAFTIFSESEKTVKDLSKERKKLLKKQSKATAQADKVKSKANKAKEIAREKKRRAKKDKLQAKRHLKAERAKFWPKKVYRIVVTLDTNLDTTPASSRRGSVSSAGKFTSESATSSDACQISLSISYITSFASWAPRYDLSLNTPTNSGTITYRAEFCNATSETWKDAKVILSTSQTAFQGLGEPIPTMQPWHIRLAKGNFGAASATGALNSDHELQYQRNHLAGEKKQIVQSRDALFGLDSSNAQIQAQRTLLAQQQQALRAYHSRPQQNGFGGGGGLFGSSSAAQQQQGQSGSLFGSSSTYQAILGAPEPNRCEVPESAPEGYSDKDSESLVLDQETIVPELPTLAIQESSWSESGMTATYDIPGLRTIIPSHTTRRHKIASIHIKDLHFSYLLVPKLRAAAFLKARLRNTSSVTLLKGPAGLTLDGSFLGNTALPRCSVGDTISLSLGVDPSVIVTYGKPVVRRSQSGILSKEGNDIYTRTCTVMNTKSNRAIEGLVLDQVPVSEDERLKVEIWQPQGLRREGDHVRSGNGLDSSGREDPKWGKDTAKVKKGGEIFWDFKIESGKGARFVLEYETRYPSLEKVVSS